jgi:hypothetical protein
MESDPKEVMTRVTQNGQWKPVATFVVEFQALRTKGQAVEQRTRVNYHDTDQEVVYPGIESEQICRWMVKQAGDKLRPDEPEAELVTKAPLSVQFPVTVTALRLYQPAGAQVSLLSGKHGQPYTGIIQAGHPFAVEADFGIGKQGATVIAKREIPYQAEFYTYSRSTGSKECLGDAEPGWLFGGKANYSVTLSGITLPSGTYCLQVVVTAESEGIDPGYFELPMLRVV